MPLPCLKPSEHVQFAEKGSNVCVDNLQMAIHNIKQCIGMCLTETLKNKGNGRELFFSASFCNNCGLCESFCMSNSVNIEKRFSGNNPFEFVSAKKELLCED